MTHLVELLDAAQPKNYGIERIIVWASPSTLSALNDRDWLIKKNPSMLSKGFLQRMLWQCFCLSQSARDEGCDILFVPGGSYAGNFRPVVTMSQNMLPFEMDELRRYGRTLFAIKLLLLRFTQSRTFKKSEGVIFLTKYARDTVLKITGKLRAKSCIVPHGLNHRFSRAPKIQRQIADYNLKAPYRLLYVSVVDQYKHQWHVVEAVSRLRKQGLPIILDLVGPAYPPSLKRLKETINREDVDRTWVNYWGSIPFNELHHCYAQADLGLFASTCENMPNILLEKMAAGLPIACSLRGPMPEILQNSGLYFDPENPKDIASAITRLIESADLRTRLANLAYQSSKKYLWSKCAEDTLKFLVNVYLVKK